jgi:hypothetical protein
MERRKWNIPTMTPQSLFRPVMRRHPFNAQAHIQETNEAPVGLVARVGLSRLEDDASQGEQLQRNGGSALEPGPQGARGRPQPQ